MAYFKVGVFVNWCYDVLLAHDYLCRGIVYWCLVTICSFFLSNLLENMCYFFSRPIAQTPKN